MSFGRYTLLKSAVALALLSPTPALACSGIGPRGHALDADVIATGRLVDGAEADVVVAKTVLKGLKANQYEVVWGGMSADDECAFLSPVYRDRGVYFLKLLPEGRYLIVWTEKRWSKRWEKDL